MSPHLHSKCLLNPLPAEIPMSIERLSACPSTTRGNMSRIIGSYERMRLNQQTDLGKELIQLTKSSCVHRRHGNISTCESVPITF